MQVEPVTEADLEDVLSLNEASVPNVNSLSMAELRWFVEHAPYFSVVRIDDVLAGFLIGLGPGLDYASPNYRYFCERHEVFGYIDRVAVAPASDCAVTCLRNVLKIYSRLVVLPHLPGP